MTADPGGQPSRVQAVAEVLARHRYQPPEFAAHRPSSWFFPPTCSCGEWKWDGSPSFHEHLAAAVVAADDGLRERVEALLTRAEAGADAWGTCSGEWLRIEDLRRAVRGGDDE